MKHLISPSKIHNSTGSHNVKLYKGLLVSKGDAILAKLLDEMNNLALTNCAAYSPWMSLM